MSQHPAGPTSVSSGHSGWTAAHTGQDAVGGGGQLAKRHHLALRAVSA